jgi:hypothetical protein
MPRLLPNAGSAQVSLSAVFNFTAMYTDGTTFIGGFDGIGNALSATLLGSAQTFNGFQFTLGAANVANAVRNATIPLPPGQYTTLLMLSAAINGNQASQNFTVTYADGTTQIFTQSISDWATPSSYTGEYGSAVMAYRNTFSGGRDSVQTIHVYAYMFALNGSKSAVSLTLPANNNVGVLAVTLVKIGMELELKKQSSWYPIILADVQTADGTNYYWSDVEGVYPSSIAGAAQLYSAWIKSAGPFKRTRDLSTDTADLILQNLSGNSIDRDLSAAIKNHEFEGALGVVRLWSPLFFDVLDQFFASLSEQTMAEDEVSFRLLQLFDTAQYDVADDIQSELCTHRFKDAACGSTGTAIVCLKRFIDCNDATRNAVERHNAILSIVPNATLNPPPTSTGGGGGDPGGGGVDGGGGIGAFRG